MPEENQSRTVPLLDNIRDYTLLYNYVNAFRQIQLESGEIYERISENERKNGVTFNPKSLTVKGMVELIHKYPSITNIGTANQKKLAQLHNYATSISSDFPTTDQVDAEKARYEAVVHQRDIDTAQAVEARSQELKGLKKNHRKSRRKLVGAVVLGILGAVMTAGIVGAFGTAVFGLITNAVTLGAGITSGLAVGGLVVGIVGGRLLFNGLSKMFSKIRSNFGKAREDWKGTRAKLRDARKEYRKEKAQRRLAERAVAFDNAYSREPYPGRNLFNANEYNNARDLNMQELPHVEPTPEEQAALEEARRRIAEQEARRNAGRQQVAGQNLENSEEELTGEELEGQQTGEQGERESEGGQQGGGQNGRENEVEPIVVGGGSSRGPVEEEIVEELDDEEEELNRTFNRESEGGQGGGSGQSASRTQTENATEVAPAYNFANMDTDDIYSDIQDMQKEDERLGRRLSRTKNAEKQEQFTTARKENEEKLDAYREELGKRTITSKIASDLYEDQEVAPKDLESIEKDKEKAPEISSREIRRIMQDAEANAQALDNELRTNNRLTVNEYRERVQKRNAYNYFAAEMANELSARTAFEEFKYGEQGMALRRALDGASNEYLEALIGDFARNMPKVAKAMEANGTGGTVWGAGERLDDQAIEYITKLGESNFGQQLVAELLEERKLTAGVDNAKLFEIRNESLKEYNALKGAPNVEPIDLARAESEFRMYDRELDTRELEADRDIIATGMQDKGNWDRDAYASQVAAANEEINKKETVGVLETEVEDTVITLRKKKEKAEAMLKEVQEKTTMTTPDGSKVETVPDGVKFSEYEGALVVGETIMQNIESLTKQIAEIEKANQEEIERRIEDNKKIQISLMVDPDALVWVGVPAPESVMTRVFKEEKSITPEQAKAYLEEFEKTGILPKFDGIDADPEFRALAEQIRINSFGRTPSAEGVNVKKSLEELAKEKEVEESRTELESIKTKVSGWREQAVKDGLIAEDQKDSQDLFILAENQTAIDAGYPNDVQLSSLIARARVLLGRVVPYTQQREHIGLDGEMHIATKEGLEQAVEAFTAFLNEKSKDASKENKQETVVEAENVEETPAEEQEEKKAETTTVVEEEEKKAETTTVEETEEKKAETTTVEETEEKKAETTSTEEKDVEPTVEAENSIDKEKEEQENLLQALIRKARGFIAPLTGKKKSKKKGQAQENTAQGRAEQIITKDMLRMQFVSKFKKGNEKGRVTGDILGARREMIDAMLGALRLSEKTSGIKEEDFIPKEILEEMVDEFINETKEFKGKWHQLVEEKEAGLNASREKTPEIQAENQDGAADGNKENEDAPAIEVAPVEEEEEKKRKPTLGLNIEVSSRMSIREEGFVFHRGDVSFVIPHEKMVVVDNDIKTMREAGKTEQQIIEKLAGDYKNKFTYEGGTKRIVQGQKNFAQVVKSYDERQEAIKNIENAREEDDLQQVVDAGEAKRLEEARREEEAREREAQEEAKHQAEEEERRKAEEEANRKAQEEAERKAQEEANRKAQREEAENSNLASRMTISQDGFEFKNNKGKTFVVPYSKMENIAKTIEVLETKEWGGNREEQIAKRLTGTKGISTGIKYRREDGEIVKQGSVTGFENFEQIYKTFGSQKAEIMQAIEEDKIRQAEAQKAREAEAEAKRQAEEEAKRQAEEEAKRLAEEEAKRQAEEEAKRQAEEEAKRLAEEEAKRQAEEEAKRQAEEEAKRLAEEEAKRQAEEEAKRQAEEEAKRQAEEEAKRLAEEEAKRQAEEEAKRLAEEEAKRQAEEEAKRQAEEEAKRQTEESTKKPKSAKLRAVEEQLRDHYSKGGKLSQQQFDRALFEAGLTADDTLLAQGIYQGLEVQRQEAIKQQKIENLRRAREEKAQQTPEAQENVTEQNAGTQGNNKPNQNPGNKPSTNDDDKEMGEE